MVEGVTSEWADMKRKTSFCIQTVEFSVIVEIHSFLGFHINIFSPRSFPSLFLTVKPQNFIPNAVRYSHQYSTDT